jgi:hypothetical protein
MLIDVETAAMTAACVAPGLLWLGWLLGGRSKLARLRDALAVAEHEKEVARIEALEALPGFMTVVAMREVTYKRWKVEIMKDLCVRLGAIKKEVQ